MTILTASSLASYLREPALEGNASLAQIVTLVNGLIEDVVGTGLSPVPARVTAVALEVAARAWRNPDGYSSETLDDYTYRRDAETRRAGVYLTPWELGELNASTGVVAGMYVLDLGTPRV